MTNIFPVPHRRKGKVKWQRWDIEFRGWTSLAVHHLRLRDFQCRGWWVGSLVGVLRVQGASRDRWAWPVDRSYPPSPTDPASGAVASRRRGVERQGEGKRSAHWAPSLLEVCLGLSSTYTWPWSHSFYIMKIPVRFLLSRGLQSRDTQ